MKISHLTQTHWASYKYLVMAHSQVEYNYIRQLFKGSEWSPLKETSYQAALTRALNTPPTIGSLTNAYQHIWGYFKHVATSSEKAVFQDYLGDLTLTEDLVRPFLSQLTMTYQVPYLLKTKLLFD